MDSLIIAIDVFVIMKILINGFYIAAPLYSWIKNNTYIIVNRDSLNMPTSKYKYHTVNLPDSLAKLIVEVIESRKYAYTSIPDFVKEAVRRYLRELGYLQ